MTKKHTDNKSCNKKLIKLKWYKRDPNFGDMLNIDLFKTFSDCKIIYADKRECEMAAIGSLLDNFLVKEKNAFLLFFKKLYYKIRKNSKPVIVYGSGFIKENRRKGLSVCEEDFFLRFLDVRAVRGYISLNRLKQSKQVKIAENVALGDPGLLISKMFDVSGIKKKYKLGIIPHYVEKDSELLNKIKVKNAVVLDVQQKPEVLIKQIAECEVILASAMHGLIAADSLGIPNVRMVMTDKLVGGDYKFNDYYSVFGINEHKRIILNERDFTDEDVELVKMQYPIDRNKVEEIQQNLLKVFPA